MYGGEVYKVFWSGNLRERGHLGARGIDDKNSIEMYLLEMGWGGMDWIDLAEDGDRSQGVVNAVMNIRVL